MISSDFLREYFRSTQGPIYIGAVRNPKSKLAAGEIDRRLTRKPIEVNQFVKEYDKPELECAIYYCTATLRDGSTSRSASDCQQFPSLFADCDDHNHDLDQGRVLELLEALESPPTMIVNSGHGLQPHWLLAEPSEDAERVITARKKLQALLASDAVHDAPRYMRLPGSHNSKGGDWLPVEIVSHHPERRYTLEVLEEWLDTAAVVIPRKTKPKGNGADRAFEIPRMVGGTDPKRGAAWAVRALEESARELGNAVPGERHATLLKKAVRMGTMVARGWVDAFEVRRVLFAAAEACGEIKEYGIPHFDKTFTDGLTRGTTMPHPDLPDDSQTGTRSEQFGRREQHDNEPPMPLPFIDMSNWDNEPVPEQEWTVFNRIPRKQSVLFSGEGAAGKSTVFLQQCAAHVLARDWLGTIPAQGPAIYIDAEDDVTVIHRRLAAVASFYGVKFRDLINGGLHVISLIGQDAVLATVSRSGKIEPTSLYKRLLEAAGDIKPVMMGFASSANVYAGSEIDRSQVQQFVSLLTRLAIVANGSTTLISHPSLTGINTGTGLSGTTQWHNAMRARYYMKSVKPEEGEQPDSDLREIEFKKNQYGPVSETIVLRYTDGLFLPLPGVTSLDRAARELKADGIFLDLLRRFTAENRSVSDKSGQTYAPHLFAQEEEARGAGLKSKDIEGAMRRLFKAGKIRNEQYGRPSRPHYHIARTD